MLQRKSDLRYEIPVVKNLHRYILPSIECKRYKISARYHQKYYINQGLHKTARTFMLHITTKNYRSLYNYQSNAYSADFLCDKEFI